MTRTWSESSFQLQSNEGQKIHKCQYFLMTAGIYYANFGKKAIGNDWNLMSEIQKHPKIIHIRLRWSFWKTCILFEGPLKMSLLWKLSWEKYIALD